MRLILLRLSHLLIITILLYISDGTEEGCDDWEPRGNNTIYCLKCKAGNRFTKRLGSDPTKLCTPCETGTFTTGPTKPYCDRCTQCLSPWVEAEACTAGSDAVCKCMSGLRCGDEQCSFCVDECGIGEESTPNRDCRKCPKGTFNDKVHDACKPWRKRCPKGERILQDGTASSDIKCGSMTQNFTPSLPKDTLVPRSVINRTEDDDPTGILYAIGGGFFAITVIFVLTLWVAYQRKKKKTETKEPITEPATRGEVRFMIVQDDACSFHQPEQEQGGSSESISTQDSESKLIV